MKRLFLVLALAFVIPLAVAHAEEGAEPQLAPVADSVPVPAPVADPVAAPAAVPNATLCEATTLAFCAQTVTIDRTSTLGTVLPLQTDKGEAVEVRCVKDEEGMLSYEIKDAGSILCPYY